MAVWAIPPFVQFSNFVALAFIAYEAAVEYAGFDVFSGNQSPTDYTTQYKIAFIGNGFQYYNDMPRVLEALSDGNIIQDSVFRYQGSLYSIANKGNGMDEVYDQDNVANEDGTYDYGADTVASLFDEASWDYVVMNDRALFPIVEKKMYYSVQAIYDTYLPYLNATNVRTVPVFIATYAPADEERRMPDGANIVSVENFTQSMHLGYYSYAQLMKPYLTKRQKPRVAPVGKAFLNVYNNDADTWLKLFDQDDLYNPSAYGTYLQALCVYKTIYAKLPPAELALPTYPEFLFYTSRLVNDNPEYPTYDEASYLYSVANNIC
mmetsp:Transcript_40830/g.47742  ORF Transcript_40830/g.47742 Transcript_40830/m.47742 type:complete len:320 (+) Transcript_40830:137-1096(+)